jgi:hypothetical protein
MFYCEVTGLLSKPNEKPSKLVVEKRDRVYTRRVKNEETREWETIEVGRGWEIVKELNASAAGVQEWASMTPEQQADFLAALKSA